MPIDERVVATPGFVDLVGAASQVGTSQCVLESSSVANCVALIVRRGLRSTPAAVLC